MNAENNSSVSFFRPIILLFAGLMVLYYPYKSFAADDAGQVVSLYGKVWVSTGSGNPWRKISRPQTLFVGSRVKTGRLSGASLRMEDESLIRLSQNSEFEVEAVRITSFWRRATSLVSNISQGVQSTYRLLTGKLWGRNNNRRLNSKIITTTATIGIRGTEYTVEASEDFSTVSILEGVVQSKNKFGQTLIRSGEQAIARKGQAPQKSPMVQFANTVQWTIQIPEIIDFGRFLKNTLDDKLLIGQIYHAYQQTQYAAAAELVANGLQNQPDNIDLSIIQAWLNIKAGESLTVYSQLKTLAAKKPAHVSLHELTAFAAFLNGKLDDAKSILEILKKKQRITDTGWIIAGYIEQAEYDLESAQNAYDQALNINPQNQIARIQLATLYFGSEQTQRALNLVNKSLSDQPENLQVTNLKGFILLSQNETSAAISVWEERRNTSEINAETYFGLSLAYMRKGRVEQAMQSIATAVLLDPQRSLYLSYWGKMLHQIGRNDKALTVLDSAIRLDKQDPTPRLYKAIVLRDLNRPGEAIRQLQAAVKLNDNRGVYRSRSLLDKDLAVQNVDLSRLFTQLGLADWAQKKAMDSIKSDFTNVSAHILNAGAFAEQGDRSYALGNEALLARILQPANINAFSSFNGYTSLFESPDTEFDLQLGAGNHGQQTVSLISAGAVPENQLAWGLAAVHEVSDGWRDVNGETFDNLSVIGKWQPSQQNNFLFTLSAVEIEQLDDLNPRFEIDSPIDEIAEFDLSSLQLELGLHHHINNSHSLILYLSRLDTDGTVVDHNVDSSLFSATTGEVIGTLESIIQSDFDRPHTQIQVQGLKKHRDHQIFYGLLLFDGEFMSRNDLDVGLFDINKILDPATADTFDDQSSFDLDISFISIYIQDSWQISPSLQLDIAAYFEEMDNANAFNGGEWKIEETTTRLGLVWKAGQHNTFRLASFEYLLPFISSRLDPTDIAGIPIFKNTNEGSLIKETDIVWDFEWENGLVSTSLFTVEDSLTTSILNSGEQQESTRIIETTGASIKLNTMVGLRTGLNTGLTYYDVENDAGSTLDRKENSASLAITHIFNNNLSLSGKQIFRQIDFDSDRENESINLTNLLLSYEFDNKNQQLEFAVTNLFDEEVNWVTDEFTTTGFAPERLFTAKYRISF